MKNPGVFCLRIQLAKLLTQRRMKPSELARRTGISKQVISDWMAGSRPRDLERVRKVAYVLGTTMDYLCFGDPATGTSPSDSLGSVTDANWIEGVFEIRMRRIDNID